MKSLVAAVGLALATLWASPALASEAKKEAPAKSEKADAKAAEKAASAAEKKVEKPKREKKGGC